MRAILYMSTFVLLFFSYNVFASYSDELQGLAIELDKANQSIDANSRRITESFVQLEKRIANFSAELERSINITKDIRDKYDDVVKGVESTGAMWKRIGELRVTQGKYEEKINFLEKNLIKIEKDISVSQTIVTWVTAIVTIVVILIGLFFSHRFLELYSGYRLICSRFPKEERERLGLKE